MARTIRNLGLKLVAMVLRLGSASAATGWRKSSRPLDLRRR